MRLHAEILKDNYHEIPGVLVNGWSGSWKKFLFSIMYHNDWYLLYPGYTEVRDEGTRGGGEGERIARRPCFVRWLCCVPVICTGFWKVWGFRVGWKQNRRGGRRVCLRVSTVAVLLVSVGSLIFLR